MFKLILISFFSSLIICIILTPLARNLALRLKLLDIPRRRKVHTLPTPYLGGLSIYLSFSLAVLVYLLINRPQDTVFMKKLEGFFLGGIFIIVLGLWDDLKDIKPWIKLVGQIIISLILIGYGFRIDLITNPVGGQIWLPLPLNILITILWMTGIINAMNLIDGLDGLAAGITFIASLSLLIIALHLGHPLTPFLFAALAGASLGFLKFNFYPAKIFMGNEGSMFLGFVLGSCAIMVPQYKIAASLVLLIPIIALAVPVFDILLAIVRRLLKRKSIFLADRKHFHHLLLESGLSHRQAVLLLYFLSLCFATIAFLVLFIPVELAFIFLVSLGLIIFLLIKFRFSKKIRTKPGF